MRTSAQRVLAAGQRIGPFVLLEPLGSGGSGRVWAAVRVGQLGFTKRMALKLLRHDKLGNARAMQRFDREAQLGARLTHPNIRAVHDLNSHEGRPYMAMRWVDTSLEELLEHAPGHALPADVACWIGLQCCAALSAAHAHVDALGEPRAIIHRDVAPGNVLLSAEGHVLLSDLAAPVDEDSGSIGASDTRFFGNIAYASPEALNEQELDGRADLYSLGCVLYQCLCGALPFAADDERSLMYQVLKRDIVDLRERAPQVPEAVAAVVRRAMAREREERFESAEAMASALGACVESVGAFALEERTTRTIREVLGERLRAREEAMHAAYLRYSVSQSGRTDTLPIKQGYAHAHGGDTQGSVPIAGAPASRSGGVVAPVSRRAARGRWIGVALAWLGLVVALYWQSGGPMTGSAVGVKPEPAATAPPQSETQRLQPAPSVPSPPPAPPSPPAPAPSAPDVVPPAPAAARPAASAARAPPAPAAKASDTPSSRRTTRSAPAAAEPATTATSSGPKAGAPTDGWGVFDKTNPYRKSVPADAER